MESFGCNCVFYKGNSNPTRKNKGFRPSGCRKSTITDRCANSATNDPGSQTPVWEPMKRNSVSWLRTASKRSFGRGVPKREFGNEIPEVALFAQRSVIPEHNGARAPSAGRFS